MRGPGHALEGDVVEIAAPQLPHLAYALLGAVGRQEEDRIDARPLQQDQQLGRLLGRHVDGEHAVDADRAGLLGERRIAHGLDRVQVAHQDDRRILVALAELADEGQGLAQAHVVREGALAGALDHRAVGHRIGERHADLEHVGAGLDQRVQGGNGERRGRITRGDEWNQGRAASLAEGLELGSQSTHSAMPSRAAMVLMSLSPRPDRLTRIC